MTKLLITIVKILNNCIIFHDLETAHGSLRQSSLGPPSWGSSVLEGFSGLLRVNLAEVTSDIVLLTTALRVSAFKNVFFN